MSQDESSKAIGEQSGREHQKQTENLIEVDSLTVNYDTGSSLIRALCDVSLTIKGGETLGIAGESGSGKSTLALAILQYLGDNGYVESGNIRYKDREITELGTPEIRELRGSKIAHVPQDPDASLNPTLTIGDQVSETILEHQDISKEEAWLRMLDLLEKVEISDAEHKADSYPHQLSGGMQQRTLIAMALCCDPELLVLDEPTTGLDVITQSKILDLIKRLKEQLNTAILLISHDLAVIAQTCERLAILYAGEVMEQGGAEEVFENPANPYTQGLLAALPRLDMDQNLDPIPGQLPSLEDIPDGCIFADRCEFAEEQCKVGDISMEDVNESNRHRTRCCRHREVSNESTSDLKTRSKSGTKPKRGDREKVLTVDNMKKHFGSSTFFDRLFSSEPPVRAVDGVDIEIHESETLGLVGESGCGKSTLGSTLLRLLDIDEGTITYKGEDIFDLKGTDLKEFRSDAQIVFQNPHSSLNPRKRIGKQLERPLELFTEYDKPQRRERIASLLDEVNLDETYRSRFPHGLSGGEKQRVAIARAFAAKPSFVVLDEPVSGLDVSVQASVLNLLSIMKDEYDSSHLFISHDLSVVKHVSDRIATMYLGKIVEIGSQQELFKPPYHPYTRALLSANPDLSSRSGKQLESLEGDVPSARNPPSGCRFHTRCSKAIEDVCDVDEPSMEAVTLHDDSDHSIACHLDKEDMMENI